MSDKPDDYFAFDAAAKIIDPQAFSKWDDGDGFDRMQVINRMNTARDKARAIAALSATQHHQGGEEAVASEAVDYVRGYPLPEVTAENIRWRTGIANGLAEFLAQQPLSVQEGWRQALDRPFCVLFLDGRNEHGSHVLASYPRSFDTAETNIEDEAETILAEAEALGFSIGDHVWAEFDWIAPQIDNEGRTELTGYWEFKRIDPNMSRVVAPTVGGKG